MDSIKWRNFIDEISNSSGEELCQCRQLAEDWTTQQAEFGNIDI